MGATALGSSTNGSEGATGRLRSQLSSASVAGLVVMDAISLIPTSTDRFSDVLRLPVVAPLPENSARMLAMRQIFPAAPGQ
jgi:hypothetical protein